MSLPTPAPVPNTGWNQLEYTSADAVAHPLTVIPVDALLAIVLNKSDTDFDIGPTTDASFYTLPSGQAFTIPWTGKSFDLRGWYAKTSAAGKVLKVLFSE